MDAICSMVANGVDTSLTHNNRSRHPMAHSKWLEKSRFVEEDVDYFFVFVFD